MNGRRVRSLLRSMLLSILLGVLSTAVADAADVPVFQVVITADDNGELVVIDYNEDTRPDEANDVVLHNTGVNAVVCVFSATMPVYSTTDKAPLAAGAFINFSRARVGPFYTHISCITSAGLTTTVAIRAQP